MSRILAAILLLALPVGSGRPAPEARVDARDYDAFWLWAGVRPQPVLAKASRIYLLQGQVSAHDPVRFTSQRPAIPHVRGADIWLVVRVGTLRWTPEIYRQVLAQLERWRSAGNRVVGIQIDFDVRTRHLEDYAAFLRDLRRRLPADCRLGITGLLDWSSNGDPKGLDALASVVDEVVLQIYQGRHVIPGYAGYLNRLDHLKIPFRVGLLQDGAWEPPSGLASNPSFKGYVVFLHNPAPQ